MESLSIEEICCILKAIQSESMECQQGVFCTLNKIIKEKKVRYYDLLKVYGDAKPNTITPVQIKEKEIASLEKILTTLEGK